MQCVHLRKYGVQTTIDFELYEVDGVDFRVDAVHAAGDTVIMKDEGAEASTSNGFTDEGTGYSIVLTATEMQAARIVIYAVDQTATKAWLDKAIVIETYGNASAMHAFDLDTATQGVDVTQISGDATAANNCEAFFDGTGYAGTGNTIPTVTTLTGHTAQTGDTFGQLPTNFASLVISAGGSIDALVQGILNTLLTEATAGRIAGNFDTFFENSDAASTKTQDDVGVAGSGLTQQNVRDAMKLAPTAGAPASGSVDEHLDDVLADTADMQPKIGTPAADLAADVAAVKTDTGNIEADTQNIQGNLGAPTAIDGGAATLSGMVIKMIDDSGGAAFDATTDSLERLANTAPLGTAMRGTDNAATAAALSTHDGKLDTVDANVDLVLADTADMQPKLGTPAADVSADIAAVKADTAAVLVDTADMQPKLGTPAADVSADIAAVKAETAAIVADTNELQTDWANGGRLDLLLDAIKVITDALGATAAANLAKSCSDAGIVSGAAATGTLSTTQMSTNLTEATDDHYIGRTIIWTSGVLLGQATDITDYVGTNGVLTFTDVTEAPSNGDSFVII